MIPQNIIDTLEKQIEGVTFGKICLEISVHDNHEKYRIVKEISFVPDKPTSGSRTYQNKELNKWQTTA